MWAAAAGAAIAVGACLSAYFVGVDHGRAAAQASAAREEALIRKAADDARAAAVEAIKDIRISHTTIKQQAQKEIQRETVYVDCRHPDVVRRLLDDALANRRPVPADGGTGVPSAASAPAR